MKKNKRLGKFRQWIQDNFFSLIIFLVLLLLITLIVLLFIPVNIQDFPTDSIELERYNAGVERRTILIRSISSLISGISVIIAFVSLLQSRVGEEKRARLEVMPFPAYSLQPQKLKDVATRSSELILTQKKTKAKNVLQSKFDVQIKNVGLGSLVDYEVEKVFYQDANNRERELDIEFYGNFILGKEEIIRMVVHLNVDLETDEAIGKEFLNKIKIIASFDDLLGHSYEQEFAIEAASRALGEEETELPEKRYEKGTVYSLTPKKIVHSHPCER